MRLGFMGRTGINFTVLSSIGNLMTSRFLVHLMEYANNY